MKDKIGEITLFSGRVCKEDSLVRQLDIAIVTLKYSLEISYQYHCRYLKDTEKIEM